MAIADRGTGRDCGGHCLCEGIRDSPLPGMQAVADKSEADRAVESENKKNREHRVWKAGAQTSGARHYAGRTGGACGVCGARRDG